MKKYILMGLLLFSIGAINAQIQVDSLIAKQKIKLHGYTLTGVSNDTDISHKDSSKVMSEAAIKRIIENHVKDSILSVRGEAIVTVEGEHENPYSPWLAPIKTLNLHGNYIDSTGAIRLNAINGYWGDTVLNQASLLLAFANTDSSHNNRIALFPNTISTAPFDYVAYQSWVQDYVSTHGGGSGSSFDPASNQVIDGNWIFQGGFGVDDGWSSTGLYFDKYWGNSILGDRGYGSGTNVTVADGHEGEVKTVIINADVLEGCNLNIDHSQEFEPTIGWQINNNGSAFFGSDRFVELGNNKFSIKNQTGDYIFKLDTDALQYYIGDVSNDNNGTSIWINDAEEGGNRQTVSINANRGLNVTAPLNLQYVGNRAGITTPNSYTTIIGATSGDANQIEIRDDNDAINFFCYDYNSTPTATFNGNGGGSLARGIIQWSQLGHLGIAEAIDLYPDGAASFAGSKFYVGSNGWVGNDYDSNWSINSYGDLTANSIVATSENFAIRQNGSFYFNNNYNENTGFELSQDDGNIYFQGQNCSINSAGEMVFAGGKANINADGSAAFANGLIHLQGDGGATFANYKVSIYDNGWIGNDDNGNWSIHPDGSATFANGGVNITPNGHIAGGTYDGINNRWWIGQDGQTRIGNALVNYLKTDGYGNVLEQTFESPTNNKAIFRTDVDGKFSLGIQIVDDNPNGNGDNEDNITHNYTNTPVISFDGSEVDFFEKHIWYTNGSFELNSNHVGINSDAINNVIQIGDFNGNGQGTKIILDDNANSINLYAGSLISNNSNVEINGPYNRGLKIETYNTTIGDWSGTGFGTRVSVSDTDGRVYMDSPNGTILTGNYLKIPIKTTEEINSIWPPAPEGSQVYNSTLHTICFFNGTNWQKVSSTNMN